MLSRPVVGSPSPTEGSPNIGQRNANTGGRSKSTPLLVRAGNRVVARAAKTGAAPDLVRRTVESVLTAAAFEPFAGLAGGEALVNVLEVNRELARRLLTP